MATLRISEWRKLPVCLAELCIDTTLRCGQSFRWKKLNDNEWTCGLQGRIISLKQDKDTHLHYRTFVPDFAHAASPVVQALPDYEDTELLIKRYFNLTIDLSFLYAQWSLVDPNFKRRAPDFTGVRILKQDPWETLVGFICSSNNNISRISQMINNLCLHYGHLIGHVNGQAFHDFPQPEALIGSGIEAHLRELGFGYRAGYIAKTALIVAKSKPEGWLRDLCNPGYPENCTIDVVPPGGREGYRRAHQELLQLPGVGPKVADCVCLMGLGWGEAVPVDTHVWQIAQRDYRFGKGKHKSLTKATYDAVGEHFRQLWGREAGWAHSVLFAADLRTFSEKVIVKIEVDAENGHDEEVVKLPASSVSVKREYCAANDESEYGLTSVSVSASQRQRPKRRRRG